MAISPVIETMQMLLSNGEDIARAWVILLPSTVVYLFIFLIVNEKWLIPNWLLKGKFSGYIIVATGVAGMASFFISVIETMMKSHLDLPGHFSTASPGWLFADAASNVIFAVPMLVSFALIKLYGKWKEDMKQERRMAENLEQYMTTVRDCLNLKFIFSGLKEILDAIPTNADLASERIDSLSEYLRGQLSGMPAPPILPPTRHDSSLFSGASTFLVSGKFTWLRHALYIMGLLLVSFMAYRNEYETDFREGVIMSAMLFIYLIAITYAAIFLFRKYQRHKNMGKFVRSIAILCIVAISPTILSLPLVLKELPTEGGVLGTWLEFSAVMSGVICISLYIFGISALLLFQDWIKVQRHITLLHTETLRQEYLFLRKQINPHFLFNVLNNIEISVYDNPAFASELLYNLVRLLEYQFNESKRDETTVNDEVNFLKSYLTLEQSRRDHFEYEIVMDSGAGNVKIPTLLFIPIIENAAKYSCRHGHHINVKVLFSVNDRWLRFECHNPYDTDKVNKMTHHGIGLENTRRRLELIYDGKAKISTTQSGNIFSIELNIPLK